MKYVIAILGFAVSLSTVNGQDITTKTITWNASGIFNMSTGDMKEESHQIITNKNNTVEWKTPSGESKLYQVNEVLGQWSNVSANGEIVYEVRRDIERGTITFLRNQGVATVKILLVNDSDIPPSIIELKISNTQVQ